MKLISSSLNRTLKCALMFDEPIGDCFLEMQIKTECNLIEIVDKKSNEIVIDLKVYKNRNVMLYLTAKGQHRNFITKIYVTYKNEENYYSLLCKNEHMEQYLDTFYKELKETIKYVES